MARLLTGARQRAKMKGVSFALTKADITLPAACPILGIPLEFGVGRASDRSPSLDRILPSMGYVPGNVMVISMRANRIKSDAAAWELQAVADFLTNHITGPWMRQKET